MTVLDERWSDEEGEVADALRALLAKVCEPAVVRAAEAAADGRDPALEARLETFGLWDLPPDPGVLAAAAVELGRALAPVPFPERAAVAAAAGVTGVWAERGWAPAAGLEAFVAAPGGVLVRAALGAAARTAAGDVLSPASRTDDVVADASVAGRASRLVRLLVAARAVGAAEAVLEVGVAYAGTRQQFGRPIGSFQAVAHRLADAAVAVDGAVLAVRKAAWVARPENGGDGAPDATFATIARMAAEDAAECAVAAVHQVMGGYGFAEEYDCQLYSRRTRAWRLRLEPVSGELVALARTLLDERARADVRWLWHHERGLPLPRWAVELDG